MKKKRAAAFINQTNKKDPLPPYPCCAPLLLCTWVTWVPWYSLVYV
jgi:hypothetical protein